MARNNVRRSRKRGLSPGTLIHVGEKRIDKARLTVIDYDGENFLEKEIGAVEECFPFRDTSSLTWINIDGVHDVSVIEKLGGYFHLHPLILEDIMTTSQRPKIEDLGDAIYIVLRMIEYDEKKRQITTEQMSLVLGPNYVLSFQEVPGDCFDPVRDRIRKGKGRIRKLGPDYLAYALIDAIIDNYFLVLERLGEKIEGLEDSLVTDPKRELLHEIHSLKREMIFLRKSVWPLREVISGLQRAESPLIKETTGIFFRDVYDHTIQVIDTVETYRDMLSGMLETYLSSISNRMNEVMKVLTIIATIFIPLSFVAGVYGMNFKFMPELEWRWGYFIILGLMVAAGVGMLAFFKRKKWM